MNSTNAVRRDRDAERAKHVDNTNVLRDLETQIRNRESDINKARAEAEDLRWALAHSADTIGRMERELAASEKHIAILTG